MQIIFVNKSHLLLSVLPLLLLVSLPLSDGYEITIPPTPAFKMINVTGGGNVTAQHYADFFTFEGVGVTITPNYALHKFTFTVTGGSSPNELYCGAGQWFNAFNATTNNFNCLTVPSGSVYENNTMSSPTHANTLVLTKVGVDLPIKGIACGGDIICSNNSTDVTVSFTDGGGSGDNLGNHTATQTLNMNNNILDNVNYISSNAVSPASIGTMRMGTGEALAWRNNANTDNNYFYFSSVDALTVTINSVGEYQLTPLSLNFAGNNATNVAGIGQNGDKADTGFLQMQNAATLEWESSPTGNDISFQVDANENYLLDTDANSFDFNLNPLINAVFDVAGTGNRLTSTSTALGDILKSDGTDFKRFAKGTSGQFLKTNAGGTDLEWGAGDGAGAVTLGSDVTCTLTASYCTVFTIPLTASSGNRIDVNLIGDSNTANGSIQMRVQFDDAGNTGYCTYRTYTSATAETLDVLSATTATDTGETVWLAGANIPMPLDIHCGFETDASAGNALVQVQNEVASTITIQKGSNYIKTP